MIDQNEIRLEQIMGKKLGAVDPKNFPNEEFDLYSIPAFDSRSPDVVAGGEIGSTKQVVQPGDVLLSKIVPHIRRAWVVAEKNGRRQIASSEWIVFRGKNVHPDYLKHILVSDPFHVRFMSTVSGVAGSLMRARPMNVAKLTIPLPDLAEQKRIAAILDKADAIRRKRQQALALTDDLLRSTFLFMFGDPITNPKGWDEKQLEDFCRPKQWKTIPGNELEDEGFPVFGANGLIGYHSEYNHEEPVVAITCRGATCGTINVTPPRCYVTGNAMCLDDPDEAIITRDYLEWVLKIRGVKESITGSAQPQITRESLRAISLPIAPKNLQSDFATINEAIARNRMKAEGAIQSSEELFNSCLQRAFRGEL